MAGDMENDALERLYRAVAKLPPPYFDDGGGRLVYHGDCRELLPRLDLPCPHGSPCTGGIGVTDPPFGINYETGWDSPRGMARSIANDFDTSLRDWFLRWLFPRPALVFGSWRAPRPAATRMLLIWDTKGALGMGDLKLPWKPSHQEIYVIGDGFVGRRDSDVLTFAPVQSLARNGRLHPHQKPVELMRALVGKCPENETVIDPFLGSGTTLRAAKDLGRCGIGIELEGRYCEISANRLRQEVLF